MRRTRFALVSLVLCSLALSAAALAGGDGPQALDDAWKKAMLAGDLDAITGCYAPDGVFWLPEAPEARGHDAIRGRYEEMLEGMKVTDIEFKNASYEASGDVGAAWGTATVTMVPAGGGESMTMAVRFTSVSKKMNGKWVYVVDHVSHLDDEEDDDGGD